MKKKTVVELGIIAVLAVALVLASVPLVKRSRVESRPLAGKTSGSEAPVLGSSQSEKFKPGIKIRHVKDDNFYVRLSRVADALPLSRDPFSFTEAGPRNSCEKLALAGITWQGETPTAIIQDGFYKVGDSTDQFKVVSIQKDAVILKDRDGQFELRLKS